MEIYVLVDEAGRVAGWSSTESYDPAEIKLNIEDSDAFFMDNPMLYRHEDGSLIKDEDFCLDHVKERKLIELGAACNQAIVGRFTVTLDGVQYQFSNDMEAQMNFDKMDRAFEKGRVVYLPWTAYTMAGDVVRVILDAAKFEIIYEAHLNHIQNNISKFRDLLMPLVAEAVTMEEVASVHWLMTFHT